MTRTLLASVAAYATLIVISIFCLFPFIWMALASVDSNAKLFLKWPDSWAFDNYLRVFNKEDGYRWFANSLFTVTSATIHVIIMSGLGGYALSRSRAWWKQPFLYAVLLIRVLPSTALLVPLYKILLGLNNFESTLLRPIFGENIRQAMRPFGFIDGYLGLIIVLATGQLPPPMLKG